MEFCEICGMSDNECRCPGPDTTRQKLEDYQDSRGLSNDEMTDFINRNNIDY